MKKFGGLIMILTFALLACCCKESYAKLSIAGSDYNTNKVIAFPQPMSIPSFVLNATYSNVTNSLITGLVEPYQETILQSFWAFKYATGIGADNTGLYFNTVTGQYEFKYLGADFLTINVGTGMVTAPHIQADNICYTNGTGCVGVGVIDNLNVTYHLDAQSINASTTIYASGNLGSPEFDLYDPGSEGYCAFSMAGGTGGFSCYNDSTASQGAQLFMSASKIDMGLVNISMGNITTTEIGSCTRAKITNAQITRLIGTSINTTGYINTTKLNVFGQANITYEVVKDINVTANFKAKRAHWYGYDNSTQPFLNTNNVQIINISNNADYSNWSISVEYGQNVTFRSTGVYECQLTPEFFQSSGSNINVGFWYQLNGIDVNWSNSRWTMPNNAYNAPLIPFEFNIINPTTDYVRFMWYSPSTNSQITTVAPLTLPTRPGIPGIILECNKMSELTTFGG